MRITTLYLDGTAESVSRMSAPIYDTANVTAAAAAATEAAAWDAFERATFPALNR